MEEKHLRMFEQHIAQGEQHISHQREIIARLQRGGHDITRAAELLATLEETQRLHAETRMQIKEGLRTARLLRTATSP